MPLKRRPRALSQKEVVVARRAHAASARCSNPENLSNFEFQICISAPAPAWSLPAEGRVWSKKQESSTDLLPDWGPHPAQLVSGCGGAGGGQVPQHCPKVAPVSTAPGQCFCCGRTQPFGHWLLSSSHEGLVLFSALGRAGGWVLHWGSPAPRQPSR